MSHLAGGRAGCARSDGSGDRAGVGDGGGGHEQVRVVIVVARVLSAREVFRYSPAACGWLVLASQRWRRSRARHPNAPTAPPPHVTHALLPQHRAREGAGVAAHLAAFVVIVNELVNQASWFIFF